MAASDSSSIPHLCDALTAELSDFVGDIGEAQKKHGGNLFSEPAKRALKRMQAMAALIRMIREKGEGA